MTSENTAEVYRQRYETFRHLDKLRWQMLQILVAIGTATALVLRATPGAPEWWFYALIGGSLVMIGWIISKINQGLRKNQLALQAAAETVGDMNIPNVSNKWKATSHWLSIGTSALGAFLLWRAFDIYI
ncbi:MAG: hypothetical protein ACU0C9_02435 [Paracoccaceae bacterium]